MNTASDKLRELKIDRHAPPPPSGRRRWIVPAVIAGVLAVGAGLWVVFGRGQAAEVRTAEVVAIGTGSASASVLDATGYVVARRMATVSAKITGRVREVLIEEGQKVDAGQVMATLDPIDADAERSLAQAQLGASRSQVASVRARLAEAEANAKRLASLVQQQLVSRAQYDEAVAARDALRADLRAAERNADVSGDRLRIANIGVDNTVVRAPFAGVVTAKAAQPGEIVSPLSAGGGFTRTGIGTVVDMDSLEVEVDVGEAYIGRVKPDMPVQTTLNAYPDWKIPGHVIAIIPTADRGKATVKVRIAIEQKDPRIVPDMGARVSFLEKAAPASAGRKPTALAPADAIVERDGGKVVFVVRGSDDKATVEATPIELGRTLGDDREVLSGLTGGERVVLAPPDDLADGARVRVVAGDGEDDTE